MKNKFRFFSLAALLLCSLTIFTSSCKSDDPDEKEDDPAVVTIEATSLEIVSGDSQSADAGTELADAIVFLVKGSDGNALADATVSFETSQGVLSKTTADSDSEGKVSVSWTLADADGAQSFTASAYKADGTTHISGSPVTFSATANAVVDPNTFTDDRDGKTYKKVTIGTQTWMQENLNYETTGAEAYGATAANADIYGLLYNGDAAKTACPTGWHLPTDEEWKTLEMGLGMTSEQANFVSASRGTDEGGKLKEAGNAHWSGDNVGATNSSAFTALGAGYNYGGTYYQLNEMAYFWTSTDGTTGSNKMNSRALKTTTSTIGRDFTDKAATMSVRCVED